MSDAQFGSTWSVWSQWSFCSNNVMIRVRACSTVRGFKCIGHNKEFQTCDSNRNNQVKESDSEEADRSEAMKQLYDDYEPETPEIARTTKKPKPAIVLPIPPPRQILPPLSAFPSGDSNSMPPSHPKMILPPGAPSGMWGNPNLATTLEPTQRTTTTQLPPTTSIIIQPMINRLVTKGDINSKEMTLQQLMESNSKNGIPLDESSIVLPENLSPQLIAEIMAEPDDESEEDYEDAEAATTEKTAWEKSSTRKILKTPDSDAIRKKATTTQNPNFFKISENDADDEVQRQIQRMQVPETARTTSSVTMTTTTITTTTTAPSTPSTTVTEPETTSTTQIVTTAQTSAVPITSSEEIVVTAATQQLETSTEQQQQQQVEAAGKASEFSMSDSDFERRFTTNDEFGSEEEKNKSNEQMNVKPELHIKHDFGNNIQRVDFDSNIGIVLPILPTQSPTSGIVITEEIPAMQPTAPAKLFKVVQPSVPMTAPRLPFGFSPKSSEVEKVYDSKSVQPQKQVIAATEQQESAEIVEVIQTTTTRKPRKPKLKKHKLGKNKRRKLSRRLKMLNNKIKISEIALLPTELAFKLPESEGRKVLPLTTIATISERKVNRTLEKIDKLLEKIETEGVHSNTPVMNQSQQLYEETLEIEKRLSELQKEVNKSKKKIEKAKTPLPSVDVVEGDTARALSWMIANMSRIVEDNPSASVVDMIPLERVVDTPAFRLQSRSQIEIQPVPSAQLPEIIRNRRRHLRRSPNKYTEWSEFSECNCGTQTRKRFCKFNSKKHTHDAPDKIQRRRRSSLECNPLVIEETRECYSLECDKNS